MLLTCLFLKFNFQVFFFFFDRASALNVREGVWQYTKIGRYKECGSFALTIVPGKRIYLRTQLSQVNVTFVHIKFSQENGMFALARL